MDIEIFIKFPGILITIGAFLLLISISLIIGFVNGRLEEVNTSLLTLERVR